MNVLNRYRVLLSLCMLLFSVQAFTVQAPTYKPFILAKYETAGMPAAISQVKDILTKNNFQVVGEYSPYEGSNILIITNDELRQHAAQSELGAFGAILRVTLTASKAGIQISYTNPIYMSHVYRMKSDLADIKDRLATALGNSAEYGPEKGLTKEELRDYQYKWLMPDFTDTLSLVKYPDQKTALAKIEAQFKQDKTGVKKVYQVDLPNKQETVIGVNMTGKVGNECSGDHYIMSRIDFKKLKSTGHLPYEIVVSKGKVYTLPAEFRIAINFPDLSMMGDNSFASIMCAPGAIKEMLTKTVGGTLDDY